MKTDLAVDITLGIIDAIVDMITGARSREEALARIAELAAVPPEEAEPIDVVGARAAFVAAREEE